MKILKNDNYNSMPMKKKTSMSKIIAIKTLNNCHIFIVNLTNITLQ